MFKISPFIQFYNASDKSGVLVFVPKLGRTTSLDFELGLFLAGFDNKSYLSKELICETFTDFDKKDLNKVWSHLISESIIVEAS
jgi:hypothetical protein